MKSFNYHIKAIQITLARLLNGKFLIYFIPGLVLTGIYFGMQLYTERIHESMTLSSEYSWIQWVYSWVNEGLNKAFSLLDFLIEQLYIFLILTVLSPFNTLLSEKLDTDLTGKEFKFGLARFINDIIRMLFIVALALLLELSFLFVYWTISFVIGLDAIDPIMYFLISAFFFGFAFYDYSLERYGVKIFGTLTFAFENMLVVLITGSIFLALYNIPYLGIPISPVITVMVSTIVYLYITKKLPEKHV